MDTKGIVNALDKIYAERGNTEPILDIKDFLDFNCGFFLAKSVQNGTDLEEEMRVFNFLYDYFTKVYQARTRSMSLEEWLKIDGNEFDVVYRMRIHSMLLKRELYGA